MYLKEEEKSILNKLKCFMLIVVFEGMSPLLFYRASEVDSWAASEVYPYKELGQSINTFKDNTNAIR